MVTVNSPPEMITARLSCARSSRASSSVDGGNLACFAFDTVAKRNAVVARCANRHFRRAHRIGGPRGQHKLAAGENGVARLWVFRFLDR